MDPETLIVALRKNAVLVVMHVVLGALVGLGFGLLTPAQYTSTASAKLAVENRSEDPNASSPISSFDKIIPTLVELGTSESTLSEVSKSTGIDQAELRKSVTVSAKTGTFIVEISATSTDPERAHAIAQAEIGALDSVARGRSYLVPGGGDPSHDSHLALEPVGPVHHAHRSRHRPGRRCCHGHPSILPEPEEPAGQGRGPVAHHWAPSIPGRLLTGRGPALVTGRFPQRLADVVGD